MNLASGTKLDRQRDSFFFCGCSYYKLQVIGECPLLYMALSENVGYIPKEIAIYFWENDQQNHWENGV